MGLNVPWHITSFRRDAGFGRYRGLADIDKAVAGDQVAFELAVGALAQDVERRAAQAAHLRGDRMRMMFAAKPS